MQTDTEEPMVDTTFERERLALFARHGLEAESRWVTDGEGRRTYIVQRGGDGECPTVLIHGGLSQAGEWSLVAGRLAGPVVIPDRPGCGLTYSIDYRQTDFRRAAADWVLDVVQGVGADKVDLVGASIGGYFCMAFALAHPERVRRLVLVGAPPGLSRDCPMFIRLLGTPGIGRLISGMKITDPETNRKRVFSNLVAHPEALPLEILEHDIDAMALPGVARDGHTTIRAVTTLRGFRTELLLREDVTHLQVPTLFLWGDADTFIPISCGQQAAASMPDARFTVVPDAGHALHLDRPATVADRITEFIESADGGRV